MKRNMNTTTSTVEKPACCTQQRVVIGADDVPLQCPRQGERAWDGHPRVFIPIRRGGEEICPYCGTLYLFPDE